MRFFKALSIRTKLILLTTACSAIALLLTCVGFVAQNIETARSSKLEQLQSQAQMLAFNSTAVLTFRDELAAQQLLQSLRMEPSIEFGCLYDSDHELLASYRRDPDKEFAPPVILGEGSQFDEAGYVMMFEDVIDEDEKVGKLFLLANTQDLQAKLFGYLKIVALVSAGALVVSIGLAILLQRTISLPIVELAQTAQEISQKDDYSIRVQQRSEDEIGHLYAAFNHMIEQVQKSQNALKTAVANMSHEIRTPINAIMGFTEILRSESHEIDIQQQREYLTTIQTSGNHLLNLINDILDLSKIEAGQVEIVRDACNPHQILSDVVSVLRVPALEKNISLEYEWTTKVPERIVTDADRLRQLLINLVNNAIKFTHDGGVQIFAKIDQCESEPTLVMEIVDTGIGIPADKLENVFEPFVQADGSVTRKFGGTGLGLAISRRIARSLGGDITAHSEIGIGSTFTAHVSAGSLNGVPMLEPGVADLRITHEETTETVPTKLPPAKILVVEDGETNRKLIRVMLERAGVDVSVAENGQIGVTRALTERFDLILMDMQMPVMDGYSATRELRSRGLKLPIVALTANAMKGDEAKCLAAGCSGYLTKPINSSRLLLKLAEELGAMSRPETPSEPKSIAQPSATERSEPATTAILSSLPADDTDFQEIIEEFVERLHEQLDEMWHAWEGKDYQELARLAHWLKGSGGTAGFEVFTEPAAELEQIAKREDGERIDSALTHLTKLSQSIELPWKQQSTVAVMEKDSTTASTKTGSVKSESDQVTARLESVLDMVNQNLAQDTAQDQETTPHAQGPQRSRNETPQTPAD